jgi:hypothetical protein
LTFKELAMNTRTRIFALSARSALLCAAAGSAMAATSVTFVAPEKYSDLPFNNYDRERVLQDLERHFAKLGASLPAGENLKVEVLDVDLAGREEPHRGVDELRVMRGMADWPRMTLRYSIEADGKVVKSGQDSLADMTYTDHLNRYSRSDSLRYEKKMIDDWFDKIAPQHERVAAY